jgi:hypothetical protein
MFMRSALVVIVAATLLTTAPATAGGFFSFFTGYTVAVTNSVHTHQTDSSGNVKTQNSTATVIYPTGSPPPSNVGQQTATNSTSPGSSGNTQSITQKQTVVILGHH